MARRTISLTGALYDYMLDVSLREPDVLRRLREETAHHEMAECQISPEQGQFMALLVKLIGAKRTLEVGVFTGYSAAWVALALPPDGRVIACDVSEEWTAIARRYWKEAGISDRIDLRLAPAVETLEKLVEAGQGDSFDFAFIDADKPSYDVYYEHCLKLIRPGGLIAFDNMLRHGRVLEETRDEGTQVVQALNAKLHTDARVDISLVPIADGLTLARKR
ncbi:MAG: class I SAM-dependent methyltransferase [Anaerolineae bacterium]|nr:class I SAM-dependent methyltransferase [Anaerolineae bacterium]